MAGASRERQPQLFCNVRLELLADYVRGASDFADAVRRMRGWGPAAAGTACEQARRQSLLAREAYLGHAVDDPCPTCGHGGIRSAQ